MYGYDRKDSSYYKYEGICVKYFIKHKIFTNMKETYEILMFYQIQLSTWWRRTHCVDNSGLLGSQARSLVWL